jgi:hypothetical protein
VPASVPDPGDRIRHEVEAALVAFLILVFSNKTATRRQITGVAEDHLELTWSRGASRLPRAQ